MAKEIEIEIEKVNNLRKYLRIRTGSKPWRANFYACIDHDIITPKYKEWLCFPKRRFSKEFPRFVNIILSGEQLIDAKYKFGYKPGGELEQIAYKFAVEALQKMNDEEDLKKVINDKNEFDFFTSTDVKIFGRTMFSIVENPDLAKSDALQEAENYFGEDIMKREYFLQTTTA